MEIPLVTIIVPTKNSSSVIEACLRSIKNQTYKNIELIIVDNDKTTDNTKEISLKYTEKVLIYGPERSPQRNFGVKNATGEYVAIIDSDMELGENVIAECVAEIQKDKIVGVVIPEVSFGIGFWAKCKSLERSFYVGIPWMEASRFFRKETYLAVGGYDESMVSGEDWDLSQRIEEKGDIGRISAFIRHNEGKLQLITTLKKKYYYAKKFAKYAHNTASENKENQINIIARYWLFFSHPFKLFRNPILGLGMLLMKTCEFAVGGVGYFFTSKEVRISNAKHQKSLQNIAELPFVSYIIPTYNADLYLELCLDSVYSQDYPKEKYEVIVADGGSADKTRELIERYNVKLIENPKRIAEYGKFLAYQESRGEFIVLLDADNVIASSDWLSSLISPLYKQEELLAAESNYLIADDFSSLNTYANLLIIVDPLARMLASNPTKVIRNDRYLIKTFLKGSVPVAGANGFVWRKSHIEKYLDKSLMKLEETNLLSTIADNQSVQIVNIPGKGIYHYYCVSLLDYIKKRKKIAKKFLERKSNNQVTWVGKRSSMKMIFSALYLATIIGPLLESVFNASRERRIEWLWHPAVSFLTIMIYLREYLSAHEKNY